MNWLELEARFGVGLYVIVIGTLILLSSLGQMLGFWLLFKFIDFIDRE